MHTCYMTQLLPAVGQPFSTPYESGCVALTEPDEYGNFEATDSDGVTCLFNTVMVIALDT